MVIRLNDLDTAELSFAEGMIMSAAGNSDQDTWPIRNLLRQFFEETILKWLQRHRWLISDPNLKIFSSVLSARRMAQKQLLECQFA